MKLLNAFAAFYQFIMLGYLPASAMFCLGLYYLLKGKKKAIAGRQRAGKMLLMFGVIFGLIVGIIQYFMLLMIPQ